MYRVIYVSSGQRERLEPGTSELQVQRPNHWATPHLCGSRNAYCRLKICTTKTLCGGYPILTE